MKMSKSDVEMEDPGKLHYDSGNNLQETESNVFYAMVESEAEKTPCVTAVLGEVNKTGDGGEDLDKCRNEVKDKTEVKDQINPKSEARDPVDDSVSENINTKSENEELINTETKAAEQTTPINSVEKHIDTKNEVEQKDTNGEVEKNKSSENDVEVGNHRENVENRPNEDIARKKLNEIGKDDMDYAEHVVGGDLKMGSADSGDNPWENRQLPIESSSGDNPRENRQLPAELSSNKDSLRQGAQSNNVPQDEDEEMEDAVNFDEDKTRNKEQGVGTVLSSPGTCGNDNTVEVVEKHDGGKSSLANQHDNPKFLPRSSAKAAENSGEIANTVFTPTTLPLTGEGDDGTVEDQTAFMKELECFYRERAMDFKPPKFYGQPLNCLKLWRAVIRLGGYDKVTGSKLWRQVGESFHPPKTCTTVSWTFRIFYEKSLLEYERHKTQSGELQLPVAMLPEVSGIDGEGNGHQGSGSGRARRDAASRAMQGWHAQRLSDSSEDKNLNNMAKHEKNLKTIGSLKQKRSNEVEHSNKAARTELFKQLAVSVVDIGPPADWVKINVRQTKDCFEVYALVPGLLREEVRVQSDPAGRVVITGQPEQVDNPWGVTPFKKVVSLPARIDPLQTSAVVSLHGRLFVRVPYEQSNN